ncbi:MAG: glycosyltransferase [Phycisphaerales bacterium]|nr:glycosyltransferase [Phycisphaerales bacterium]
MSERLRISVIIATYNRKDILLGTIRSLTAAGIDPVRDEIILVDNGSTDDTRETLSRLAGVTLIKAERNFGSCAKAIGADHARGEFYLFLDDDARPRSGSLQAMISHFEADSKLGAASFMVHLPDGRQECSALPHVFVGCGVGIRAWAYRQAGGLDRTFFMQAEEYDLSFRLLAAGWKVETFSDLHVDHLKSTQSRPAPRTAYYDVCNNLRVIARYLPAPYRAIYLRDWLQRYAWIAAREGQTRAFRRGALAGRFRAMLERGRFSGHRLSATEIESLFCWTAIRRQFEQLRDQGVRRVILADLGKNIHAFHRGAQEAGIDVLAVADDRFAAADRTYRGTPLITIPQALSFGADAFVVSNTSWVHAEERYNNLVNRTSKPVYSWFTPPETINHAEMLLAREASRRGLEVGKTSTFTTGADVPTVVVASSSFSQEDVGAWGE